MASRWSDILTFFGGGSPGVPTIEVDVPLDSGLQVAAEQELPESPRGRRTSAVPSYVTSAQQRSDTFLPLQDLRLGTYDIEGFRSAAQSTSVLLRNLNKANPDLSSATFTSARMAITDYRVLARNLDGTPNFEGTKLVQQLCRKFDLTGAPKGFNDYPSIRSASESMLQELDLLGGTGVELVLNSARLPEGIRPIAVDTIRFKYANKRRVPYQIVGGEEISLDYPTVFYTSLDQDLTQPYCDSPKQSALQPIQASQGFQNDLRRVLKRAIQPRIKAMINSEKWRETVPADVKADPDKLREYTNNTITSIQTLVNGLNPEDALVFFDAVDFDYLNNGNTSLSDEYKILSDIFNGKLAAGVKAQPVVLGHAAAASTNIASTQSMLSVKIYESMQKKLDEIFSRMLTVAVRLFGVDCVVEFKFVPAGLRPQAELEAYKAMGQSRTLELLSIGMITDEEASLELTGSLPPVGAPALSGTFFHFKKQMDPGNPNSQTSVMDQTLQPDTPAAPKSANGGQ